MRSAPLTKSTMIYKFLYILAFACLLPLSVPAQLTGGKIDPQKEAALKARTKQVSQFIRRFNSEESPEGQRYASDDPKYRNQAQRMKYMPYLFDQTSENYTNALKKKFLRDVVKGQSPQFLSFHGDNWFAEVNAAFTYKGSQEDAILFMELEPQGKGYQWAFANVYFTPHVRMFSSDTSSMEHFLHPLSHEVDFMNLKKAFKQTGKIEHYAKSGYKPDYLSLFFYELKQDNLKFSYVKQVKFHFMQLDGWYFEVSHVERRGKNAGWLITNLIEVPDNQKDNLTEIIQLKQ